MKYKLLLKKPLETDCYGHTTGTCEIYKPSNSMNAVITTNPVFKDTFTSEIITFSEDHDFINTDPNELEITTELVLSGIPSFNTECREIVTFNAWYIPI